jgi:hypothetical protein
LKAGCNASWKQTALAAMTCISGPPWMPGKACESISLAYFSLHRISPPRGPRRVLCVVVVTKSACSTGLGCSPVATRPGDVRDVRQQISPDLAGDFAHARNQ